MLHLHDITWDAPDGRRVLAGVDLALAAGESLWLSGPSGGGKSTVLRIVNRLLEPAGGRAEFLSRPLAAWPVTELRRKAALLSQTPVMLPGSVADNLAAPFRLKAAKGAPAPDAPAMERALAAAGFTGLDLSAKAAPLSVGQKQRVALARVLLMGPSLLLLDEPIAALDPESARKVARAAGDFAAAGGSVLMVSHQPPDFACQALELVEGHLRAKAGRGGRS